ncbi:hypothetical protein Tco_1313879 [Tanacetum coccineum]
MPVYDTDIEDVIEEEEGFVGQGGFEGEEDNIEGVVVVANDLCSSMIQTTLSVDFSKTRGSNPHELIWLQKGEESMPVYDTDIEDVIEEEEGFVGPMPGDGIAILSNAVISYKRRRQNTHDGVRTRTNDQSADGKLRDRNVEESWALLEDLALYYNESWNDPRDFAKPVKAISVPQDVLSTSDRRLVELKNQVQRLMEAHLAPKQSIQVKKITSSCEICSGPHDTQNCIENPEQAFVDCTSSRNNKVGGKQFTTNQGPRSFSEATNAWKDKLNFDWIAAEANMGYYFMDTTIIIIENDSKETLFKRYVIIHLKSEFYKGEASGVALKGKKVEI